MDKTVDFVASFGGDVVKGQWAMSKVGGAIQEAIRDLSTRQGVDPMRISVTVTVHPEPKPVIRWVWGR